MEGLQEGERTLIQPDCPPLAPPTCGNHFTGAKVCPSGGAEVLHMLQPVDKVLQRPGCCLTDAESAWGIPQQWPVKAAGGKHDCPVAV